MDIKHKTLIEGAWWQYELKCPSCKHREIHACPRGDVAVVNENPCPNGCDGLSGKVVDPYGLDKEILSHVASKRPSRKKSVRAKGTDKTSSVQPKRNVAAKRRKRTKAS